MNVPRLLADRDRFPWWGLVALAAVLVAGGALVAYETRGTTFFEDEWKWILTRRGNGLHSFLDPHNQHLSLVPVVIYKVLFATVGLRHYWPFRACMIGAQLACVALVFIYARSRVGSWMAALAAALIMFFGPGWQDILWPFQIAWVIAVAAGIGALIALDGHNRAGRICACALLTLALASAGPGLAVAAGLVVEVVWRRPRRELWIVGLPVLLYLLWTLAFQQTSILASSLLLVPRFVFDSAAGVLSSLTGVAHVDVATDTGNYLEAGPALVILALALVGFRLVRLGRVPPRVVTLAVIALSFWIIAGVGRASTRVGGVVLAFTGDESRYLYVGAVWTLLLGVELVRGISLRPRSLVLATVLAGAVVISNIGILRDGGALLRGQAQVTGAEIGTLDMTRDIVAPSYASNGFVFFASVTAQTYFAAERQLGSSAPTPAGIAADSAPARAAADAQLIRIHQPAFVASKVDPAALRGRPPAIESAGAATISARSACVRWHAASGSGAIELTLPARGLLVRADGAPAAVSIRRFAPNLQPLGMIGESSTEQLVIGPDLAPQPWHIQISSTSRVLACAL